MLGYNILKADRMKKDIKNGKMCDILYCNNPAVGRVKVKFIDKNNKITECYIYLCKKHYTKKILKELKLPFYEYNPYKIGQQELEV